MPRQINPAPLHFKLHPRLSSVLLLECQVDEPEEKIANKDVAPADGFGGIQETGEQVVELEKHNEVLERYNKELEKRNREMERRMKALEQELATANTDAAKLRRQLDKALEHRNQDLNYHQDILRLEIDSFKNSFASKEERYQKQLRNRDEWFSHVGKAVKEIRETKFLVKGIIEYPAECKAEEFTP